MTVNLQRFFALKEMYKRIEPLAERKALEIGRSLNFNLDDDNLDLLVKRYEVFGIEKQKTFRELLREYDLRRKDIETGDTTNDIAQDIVFAQHGLNPHYSLILDKTRQFLNFIGKEQHIMVINYWEKIQQDDTFFGEKKTDWFIGCIQTTPIWLISNPMIKYYNSQKEIDPDKKRPSLVMAFNMKATYSEGWSLSSKGRDFSQKLGGNLDPRVLPNLCFENAGITATIPKSTIFGFYYGIEEVPASLIKVEIICDQKRIEEAMSTF